MGAGYLGDHPVEILRNQIELCFELSQRDKLKLQGIMASFKGSFSADNPAVDDETVQKLRTFHQELLERKEARQSAKLSGWLVHQLPRDWRSDLEELRCEWIAEGCPKFVVSLKTLNCLLEMLWAVLEVKWLDFTLPSPREKTRGKDIANQLTVTIASVPKIDTLSSTKMRTLVFDGLDGSLEPERLSSIVEHLKQLTNDSTIKIVFTKRG